MNGNQLIAIGILAALLFQTGASIAATQPPRRVLSLDGTWQIAEGKMDHELEGPVVVDVVPDGEPATHGFSVLKSAHNPLQINDLHNVFCVKTRITSD
jgi:hypothetical protein